MSTDLLGAMSQPRRFSLSANRWFLPKWVRFFCSDLHSAESEKAPFTLLFPKAAEEATTPRKPCFQRTILSLII